MSNRLFNDNEFDAQFRSTEKLVKRGFLLVAVLWLFGVLLSLGLTGVVIWAIVKLVQHFCA